MLQEAQVLQEVDQVVQKAIMGRSELRVLREVVQVIRETQLDTRRLT